MLTFEINREDRRLDIHGDAEGLQTLAERIATVLAEAAGSDLLEDRIAHIHLVDELAGAPVLGGEVVAHVKIWRWEPAQLGEFLSEAMF